MPDGFALFCDEYELTMAQSFWRHDDTGAAAFELSVRSLPANRGYLVVGGVEAAVDYLETLRFTPSDLAWLRESGYDGGFVDMLGDLRFTGDVEAIPEGTAIGPATPILRVCAPRIQATLVETALLALVNHETLIATKAARVVEAAAGRAVWDFSARRQHGLGAAVGVARAAYIGGCSGTATVLAGRELGIPTTGTMAHHYVMHFGEDGEQDAFVRFLEDFPGRATLLVDTYDTQRGVARAIAAARATGIRLAGIRIDSGDLDAEARKARAQLDAADMRDTLIVASGDLDEYRIRDLMQRHAPIDVFGVGTRLGVSDDAPALGGVYKIVAQQDAAGTWLPLMKFSHDKVSDPGMHQVFRRTGIGDTLALADEQLPGRPLLRPFMTSGVRCFGEMIQERRARCRVEVGNLPVAVRRLESPQIWPVERSAALRALHERIHATEAV